MWLLTGATICLMLELALFGALFAVIDSGQIERHRSPFKERCQRP